MPVIVEGLNQLRRDLRYAAAATPTATTAVLREVGKPLAQGAADYSPSRSGRLKKGYKVQVRGSAGSIVNAQPYAGGAEWGLLGKWSGFAKYGGRGKRFGGRVLDEKQDWIVKAIYEGLRTLASSLGWFKAGGF